LAVVSEEAFRQRALAEDRVVHRVRRRDDERGGVPRSTTDLKGEMATVGAVLSWADRTDARPQPEPATTPFVGQVPLDETLLTLPVQHRRPQEAPSS
jgi:hypothetical protein